MSRRSGYTLVELVVVLVIAAILAAFALPYFTDSESRATWFHESVKSAVRHAQRQAVAQRRCVFVVFSATQLELFYGDSGCALPAPASRQPLLQVDTGAPYVLAAPAGVTLASTSFSFNGLGQPSAAGTLTVAGRQITVAAETGYIY